MGFRQHHACFFTDSDEKTDVRTEDWKGDGVGLGSVE